MFMSALVSFASAIVKNVMDYFNSWLNAEKAKANEWEAKARKQQLKSSATSREVERDINNAEVVVPGDALQWNKPLTVLLLVCLFNAGCGIVKPIVFYAQRQPVIQLPSRPLLADASTSFTERELQLVTYAATLEARIKKYNEFAIDSNKRNGYSGYNKVEK